MHKKTLAIQFQGVLGTHLVFFYLRECNSKDSMAPATSVVHVSGGRRSGNINPDKLMLAL